MSQTITASDVVDSGDWLSTDGIVDSLVPVDSSYIFPQNEAELILAMGDVFAPPGSGPRSLTIRLADTGESLNLSGELDVKLYESYVDPLYLRQTWTIGPGVESTFTDHVLSITAHIDEYSVLRVVLSAQAWDTFQDLHVSSLFITVPDAGAVEAIPARAERADRCDRATRV